MNLQLYAARIRQRQQMSSSKRESNERRFANVRQQTRQLADGRREEQPHPPKGRAYFTAPQMKYVFINHQAEFSIKRVLALSGCPRRLVCLARASSQMSLRRKVSAHLRYPHRRHSLRQNSDTVLPAFADELPGSILNRLPPACVVRGLRVKASRFSPVPATVHMACCRIAENLLGAGLPSASGPNPGSGRVTSRMLAYRRAGCISR